MKTHKGFSLIELIVAAGFIIILGIGGFYLFSKNNFNKETFDLKSTTSSPTPAPGSNNVDEMIVSDKEEEEEIEDLSNCVRYYDGCNWCDVENGQITTCTKRFCPTIEESGCLEYNSALDIETETSTEIIDLTQAQLVQERHVDTLMEIPGVVGVGLSQDSNGSAFIQVYILSLTPEVLQTVPAELEGIPVKTLEIGPIQAL